MVVARTRQPKKVPNILTSFEAAQRSETNGVQPIMHICMSECKAPVIDVPQVINDCIWGPQSIFIRCGVSGNLHMI